MKIDSIRDSVLKKEIIYFRTAYYDEINSYSVAYSCLHLGSNLKYSNCID